MAVHKTTEKILKEKGYSEIPDELDVRSDGTIKEPSTSTKKRRSSKKAGKYFEDELKRLLQAVFPYVRRVFDTRTHASASSRMIAPKVHTDFECFGYDLYGDQDYHIYVEAKSGKSHPSYNFWTNIIEEKRGDKIRSKEHQWGWVREVFLKSKTERAIYALGNRHSTGQYYIILMDWTDILRWKTHCEATGKRSIQWAALMRNAGIDKILYQADGNTNVDRFVTQENIQKLKKFLQLPDDHKFAELDYEW